MLQEGHPACKKLEWWGAGMVVCLERDADLHTAQLMPLTVSCFSKIQIGFTFLVPAHPSSPGKGPLNVCRVVNSLSLYTLSFYFVFSGFCIIDFDLYQTNKPIFVRRQYRSHKSH